ncbi:MAG: hypothetical protein Tsb0020_14400 [Haliangiales bacterium]
MPRNSLGASGTVSRASIETTASAPRLPDEREDSESFTELKSNGIATVLTSTHHKATAIWALRTTLSAIVSWSVRDDTGARVIHTPGDYQSDRNQSSPRRALAGALEPAQVGLR